jgi:hypothetical protein
MSAIFSDFPWLAVLVATLAYFMLGAIWYSPVLFSKPWLRYTGIDMNAPDAKKGTAAIMTGSFIMMLIAVTGLGILVQRLDLTGGWISGLKLGATTGICFAATGISVAFVYEKRPLGLHLIDGGYTILGHILAAIILCLWR